MSIKAWQPAPDPNKMTCCAEHRLSETNMYTISNCGKVSAMSPRTDISPDDVVPDIRRQSLFERPVVFRVELR